MNRKKIIIPHEHGGWAMVLVPFLLGMFVGEPTWIHLPLFFAWFFIYLASYPLLQLFKKRRDPFLFQKWSIIYGTLAVLFLFPVLLIKPILLWFGPIFALLFGINIWHVKMKRERAILNDAAAILSFSIGAAAAYFVGTGMWSQTIIWLVLYSFLFFMSSVFFVKTIIRERNNPRWLKISKIAHVFILLIPAVMGHLWMCIPYIYPVFRIFYYGGVSMRPMKIGIIEIVGTVQFLLLALLFLSKI